MRYNTNRCAALPDGDRFYRDLVDEILERCRAQVLEAARDFQLDARRALAELDFELPSDRDD